MPGRHDVDRCDDGERRSALLNLAALNRTVTVDGDAMHDPLLAVVIVDRVMLDAAIVPECDCVRAPSEAAGEFRLCRMAIEEIEQRRALLLGHTGKADREVVIDVKRLAAGLGMGAHDRVLDLSLGLVTEVDLHRT